MSIWKQVYGALKGGWKTFGPNAVDGPGAFDQDSPFDSVTATTAVKLSALWACLNLRAEIIGSLPLHLRDANKKIVTDHPLHYVLQVSPNYDMTRPEFWSLATAMTDMHGNSVNIIERGTQKKVVALTPCDPLNASFEYNKSRTRKTWKIGQDTFDDEDILHLRGFSLDASWGMSRLETGRQILQSQLTANRSAMMAFKQGLKVGGFFVNEGPRDFDTPALNAFNQRLDVYGRPENAGKWMTLLRGMKPIAGTEFSVKPSDAQLLESRYFGIEEICRLCNVPPQLIGHTNKASSWASSIENINLFFLMYSLQPTLVRNEASINKKLLRPADIAAGLSAKFNVRGLLRADMKTQNSMFASAIQTGYYNRDEVRDLLDMPPIPNGEGQKFTVQLNMTDLANVPESDGTGAPKPDEDTDK